MPLGHVTAFFVFDVSDAIDLQRLRSEIDASVAARLATKPATPTYLQYQQPPLTLDGAVIGAGEADGCRVRFKVFGDSGRRRGPRRPAGRGSWHGDRAPAAR